MPGPKDQMREDVADIPGADFLIALGDLVLRSGATAVEFDTIRDDPADPGWFVTLRSRGARISVEGYPTAATAAIAMAMRILSGASCKCTRKVVLHDDPAGCRWKLMGDRWEPGCTAPSIRVIGERGDHAAVAAAYEEHARNLRTETGDRTS